MPNALNLRENPENAYAKGYGRGPSGYLGSLRVDVPPTATAAPYPSASLESAIQQLITPGLVPDIARQSAEVAAGRGIAGSPAADSTAVRMSEQNYLQRLGLANQLLSGEAGRTLPYQITPYQSAEIALKKQALDDALRIAAERYGGGRTGGGQAPAGGRPTTGASPSPWASFPTTGSTFGTMPSGVTSAFPRPVGGGSGTSLWGGAGVGGALGGAGSPIGGGGDMSDWTIDDILDSLGLPNLTDGGGGPPVDDGGLGFDYLE